MTRHSKNELRAIAAYAASCVAITIVKPVVAKETVNEHGDVFNTMPRKYLRKIKRAKVQALTMAHAHGTSITLPTAMG